MMRVNWNHFIPMVTSTNKMASVSRTISEVSGSLTSDTSNPIPPESLLEMEDEEIKQILRQTEYTHTLLSKEVAMFEKFFKRLDPKDTQVKSVTLPVAMDSRIGQRKKGRQKAAAGSEKLQKLTVEQKCDIAIKESEELREEIKRKIEEREKVMDHYKATMNECDCMTSELNRSCYEFERDIVRGGINPRTGKLFSEKIIKYFEDYVRSRDNLMEKLRLKTATMRIKRKKLMIQLKQKEESGEIRHEVDFDQLKIENQQLQEKINAKNATLLQLKLSAGKTMQTLNFYKKKVNGLSAEFKKLSKEIAERNELMEKIENERIVVIEEKERAEQMNKEGRSQLEDYHVPDVMEYVREKAHQYELLNNLHIWQRKVEIAEMTLHTYQQTWYQLTKKSLQYKSLLA